MKSSSSIKFWPIAKYLNSSAAIVWGRQYFYEKNRNTFMKISYRFFKKLHDFKYELMYRFIPKHQYNIIRTGLKPGYYDIDHVMLHGMMALLVSYVEREQGGEKKFADHIKSHVKEGYPADYDQEALDIYRWWKYEYTYSWDNYYKCLRETYSRKAKWKELPNGNYSLEDVGVNPAATLSPEALHKLEEDLYDKEQEMLYRLVTIRRCLWT